MNKEFVVWIVSYTWIKRIDSALRKAGIHYAYFNRDYRFKEAVARGERPNLILSDGKCRTRDQSGEVVPIWFNPGEHLPEVPLIQMWHFPKSIFGSLVRIWFFPILRTRMMYRKWNIKRSAT